MGVIGWREYVLWWDRTGSDRIGWTVVGWGGDGTGGVQKDEGGIGQDGIDGDRMCVSSRECCP